MGLESKVFCDGNMPIDQGGHGVKFLSHGTKEQPHDLDDMAFYGSNLAALQLDEKFCTGCGNWRAKVRFSPAPERHTYDDLFPVCMDCQRIMFPHTLGLRWCSKCCTWLEASEFGAAPNLCRRHAAEKVAVWRKQHPVHPVT